MASEAQPKPTISKEKLLSLESSQPHTAKYFSELPKELRLQIWGHAILNQKREVKVQMYIERDGERKVKMRFKSKDPVPPTLHACRESREEALRVFVPIFDDYQLQTRTRRDVDSDIQNDHRHRTIYINPSTDTLFLTCGIRRSGWSLTFFDAFSALTGSEGSSWVSNYTRHAWERFLGRRRPLGNWSWEDASIAAVYSWEERLDEFGCRVCQEVVVMKKLVEGEDNDVIKVMEKFGPARVTVDEDWKPIAWWDEAWMLFLHRFKRSIWCDEELNWTETDWTEEETETEESSQEYVPPRPKLKRARKALRVLTHLVNSDSD